MSFTSTVTLHTKDPFTIEFLGNPSRVMHNITGKVHLHVQKTVSIKSVCVAFVGEAYTVMLPAYIKSDPELLAKIVYEVPDAASVYQPGTYDFPFTLALPGHLITTNRDRLLPVELFWSYSIQTYINPSSIFARRKVAKYPVTLMRKQIRPSDTAPIRFGARRPDEFDVTVMVPRMVGCQDTHARILIYMHPYLSTHRVRNIQLKAIQIEKIDFDDDKRMVVFQANSSTAAAQPAYCETSQLSYVNRALANLVQSTRLKDVSPLTTVDNPDQQEFTAAWGREHAVEVEIAFSPDADMSPAEEGLFIKITHAFQLTINFFDPEIRPMSVNAPFTVGDILEVMPTAMHSTEYFHDDGLAPPDYGDAEETSTLLDANTSRVARSLLTSQAYPEREVIVVPDVADELPPPTYDDSELSQGTSAAAREKEQEHEREP